MSAKRGNPYLSIRLPQQAIDDLKELVGEGEGGKAGGVSLFIRQLIYLTLEKPMPAQWGEEAGEEAVILSGIVEDINELMQEARNGGSIDPERADHLLRVMAKNAHRTTDLAHQLKYEAIVGRLCIEMFRSGRLKLTPPSSL